jgi:hypothetical protein
MPEKRADKLDVLTHLLANDPEADDFMSGLREGAYKSHRTFFRGVLSGTFPTNPRHQGLRSDWIQNPAWPLGEKTLVFKWICVSARAPARNTFTLLMGSNMISDVRSWEENHDVTSCTKLLHH